MSEYVDFTIASLDRFTAMKRVFDVFKHDKDAEDWRPNEELLEFFDEESLAKFYWPPDDLRQKRTEDLRTRPVAIIPTDQATELQWDFDSLIDAFVNGEYNLIRCELVRGNHARLSFYALAYPYGGVGCMVALIEAFDGVVTGIEDGAGFVEFPRS
ncbi:hypothetical protein M4951_01510 [Blastopirellula sp. J2-11]|uniref:hypothetical protein n=1 Tax=Blastopirellula sp. J2-11 TaxID=2943192 RepID=UPI0021C6672F|nr:hypothetical protein [Blastopirellula sp. J2-11]UUO07003.1 hypothetical protein M4951_01510 [Blastopirellula sp. J2-11]